MNKENKKFRKVIKKRKKNLSKQRQKMHEERLKTKKNYGLRVEHRFQHKENAPKNIAFQQAMKELRENNPKEYKKRFQQTYVRTAQKPKIGVTPKA